VRYLSYRQTKDLKQGTADELYYQVSRMISLILKKNPERFTGSFNLFSKTELDETHGDVLAFFINDSGKLSATEQAAAHWPGCAIIPRSHSPKMFYSWPPPCP